jgi:hypothetical protein
LAFALFITTSHASARPFRVADIPNGSERTCLNCHGDTKGSTRTDFGSDAQTYLGGPGAVQQQHVDWTPLCPLDSDGDGWTNGKELGDPDCTWKAGDPDPKAFTFNPGDENSHPFPICGNGKLDADEPCEGTLMSATSCMEEDAGEGQLGCTEKCAFDYSGCSMPPGASPYPEGEFEEGEEGCGVAEAGAPASGGAGVAILVGIALARIAARRPRRIKASIRWFSRGTR